MFSIFLFFEVEKYSTFWGVFWRFLAEIDKSIFGWAFVCSGRSLRLGRHLGMVLRMILADDFASFSNYFGAGLFPDGHLELPRILKRFAKHCSLVFIFVWGMAGECYRNLADSVGRNSWID